MRVDIRKVFVVVVIYYFVILIQSCCNCEGVGFPYRDYKAIAVLTNVDSLNHIVSDTKELHFTIRFDSLIYTSQTPINCNRNSLISQANACSCVDSGENGNKYKIKNLYIYPDSVFNTSIPLGMPINELLEVITSEETATYLPLNNAITLLNISKHRFSIKIRLKSKPIAQRPYTFRIELIKENGEILTTETKAISWEN